MSTRPDELEDDFLAAEYVLRLPGADEMPGLRARIANERGLAAAVEAWEARFAPLFDEIAPVPPAPGLWARIEAAIRSQAQAVAATPITRARRWRTPIWIGAAVAAGVALVVGAYVVDRSAPVPVAASAPAPLFASIAPEGAPALATARYDVVARILVVTPAALTAAAGSSSELWVVPADGRPRSLGLIAPGPPVRIALADDLAAAFASAPTLAISTEAAGGSRTGQPSGPIVASAELRAAAPASSDARSG